MITQERLKELLYYHPESGDLVWLVNQGRALAGMQAGTPDEKGYIRIKLDGIKYRAHRIAWFYVTGTWPSKEIDHRDLTKNNNVWSNLREADDVQQNANKLVQRNNACGQRGVSFWKGRWRAVLYMSKKQKFLGYFKSKEAAALAYLDAAHEHFGEFARL